MLSDKQCEKIERALRIDVEPRKIGLFLCLHIGLTLSEGLSLKVKDIDLSDDTVSLESNDDGKTRVIPIPTHVKKYLQEHCSMYTAPECYVVNNSLNAPAIHVLPNMLSTINSAYQISESLSVTDLRYAFVRRCIQVGMDLYSISNYVGIKQPSIIYKRFEEYFKPDFGRLKYLNQYSLDKSVCKVPKKAPKIMRLLILGAGSQGPVVKEIAEAMGVFSEIAFLDDNPNNPLAIGALADCEELVDYYPVAIPSFGNGELRKKWVEKLEKEGYIVPTLIHPSAMVSPNAKICNGVVIEAKVIVSSGAVIRKGALISGGSVVEVISNIGEFAHIGSAVTVSKGVDVKSFERIPSGMTLSR